MGSKVTIAAWLEGMGLGQYASAFTENAVDVPDLPDMTEADLERLGIPLGHRKRMLRAILARSSGGAAFGAVAPGQAAAVPHHEAERRQLTVLFGDLVGSTALAVRLDPEDLREVIRGFQDTCVAVIARMGGHIARFMGDGVLAYFGYPRAHEDDAERAVRAGLDLVAKVGRLVLPSGEPLQVRVGIATGLVVVGETIGEGPAQEQAVVGETPQLAARLQSLAAPDTVVVAASTRRLLGSVFVCEDLGSLELKGISEPVRTWRVTGERAVESRFDAVRSSKLTRFVGRDNELRQLMDLWQRAKAGEGQVALLCGEAGIGKSRIIRALSDRIVEQPHATIQYQCSPFHTNSPLYPAVSQLEFSAHFEREDTPEAKLDKLEALLGRADQSAFAEAALCAALLSIPTNGRYPALALSPQRQKDLTIDALIGHIVGMARTQPLLLVIEDVHWIDPTTLELIRRCLEPIKAAPVLCLITFRPEFFAPWLDETDATKLRLNRLGRDQARAMIFDVAGHRDLPVDVYEQIVSKTDGVPLFVEELTKMIVESGLLQDTGDRYVAVGPLPRLAIPATLHDSLMARLDRLTAVKEIAQIGAAIGREFSYRLLACVAPISGRPLQAALGQLTAAELIFVRGEPPESTYVFKHALVQDAAYASLLRGRRQQLHGWIAEALKDQFAEIVETQPELMAHHLAQAGRIEPAIDYLSKAGQRAIERSANEEAIGHLRRGLELLESVPDGLQRPRIALALQVMLAQAMIAGRGYAAAETKQALLRAKALIDDSTEPSRKFAVLYGIWACHYVGGEVALQRQSAAEFLAEADRNGGAAAQCLAHRTLGTTYVTMGEFAAGRSYLERARELYDPEQHPRFHEYGQDIGTSALSYLCWALWHLGHVDQASAVALEAVKRAETLAHPLTLAYAICHARGMMDIFRRRPDETASYASIVVALGARHEIPFWTAGGRILDGWAASCRGEPEGLDMLRKGLAAWRETGALLWLPMFLALEAEAEAKAGHGDLALRRIEEALAVADETGERWAIAEVLRIKAGLLAAAGRDDQVEALLIESLEIARRQGARCWELRAACDLAQVWRERGRGEQARELLQSIYAQFTEGFDTADLQNAKALIESLRPSSITEPGLQHQLEDQRR